MGFALDMHQLDCQHRPMAKKRSAPKKPAASATKKAPGTKKTTAKKTPRKKAGSKKGVRYSDEQKAKIVQFVQDHNQANGRGGQSAAVKKFGVSALTISKWSKKDGKSPQKAPAASKRKVAPKGAADTAGKLQRMLAIQQQLEILQAEFASIKSQL